MLGEEGDRNVVAQRPLTRIEGQHTGGDSEHCRLPRAVGPDQGDAVSALDRQVDALVHDGVVIGFLDPLQVSAPLRPERASPAES